MPTLTFQLTALIQVLGKEHFHAEALFYPEVSCVGDNPTTLLDALNVNARKLLKDEDKPLDYHRRRGGSSIEIDQVTVLVEPSRRLPQWRHPVELSLPLARWQHPDGTHLARVPALNMEVLAPSAEELLPIVQRHVQAGLLRLDRLKLFELALLARAATLTTRSTSFEVDLPTPRQVAQERIEDRERKEAILPRVATDLRAERLVPAYEVAAPLSLLAESLAGRQPRAVLLIGRSGVGKTALVHELVRRRQELGLGDRPFWATSGARLVAGQSGFGMWQQRCQQVWREASRTRAILHLGNLVELLDVGKSEHQTQGLASFLRPWLARGDLLAILECTPEQLPILERQDPHLVRAFTPLRIEEASSTRLRTILDRIASTAGAVLQPDALDELLRLHRRYATYSASPGRPVRFLRNLLVDHPPGEPITRPAITGAFTRETGLPAVLLDDAMPLDLFATRSWFAERVIGQAEAVALVTDTLSTVKASLNPPRKPIASLLFIGPTGVGKTETAKALAEFLFGSRDRLTRFDMSEYGDPVSVQRLIGTDNGNEGLLTARVREQPFGVVLLDEVEKAHPQLFDLLLQVLGEGRLTDARGRLADFTNTVLIMTSNLGAESYQQGKFGLVAGDRMAESREHFTMAVERELRPELFNRIDRIVPFAPLDESVTRQIASRQMDLLRLRDGVRYRAIEIDFAPDLAAWLVQVGHDVRYGARPLKRAMERQLLAPMATQMNLYAADLPLRVRLGVRDGKAEIEVRSRTDDSGQKLGHGGFDLVWSRLAREISELRRLFQQLASCASVLEIGNALYQREQELKRQLEEGLADPGKNFDPRHHEREKLHGSIQQALLDVTDCEEEILFTLYQAKRGDGDRSTTIEERASALWAEFQRLLLAVYLQRFERAHLVSMAVFSEDTELMFRLASIYRETARTLGSRLVEAWQLVPGKTAKDRPPGPDRRRALDAAQLFSGSEIIQVQVWDPVKHLFHPDPFRVHPSRGVVGLGLQIHADGAFPRFGAEEGLHRVQLGERTVEALVVTGNVAFPELELPEGIDRKGAIGTQPRRRLLRPAEGSTDDVRIGIQPIPTTLEEALPMLMARALEKAAREVLS